MKIFCDLHGKALFVVLYNASYVNQGKHRCYITTAGSTKQSVVIK